MNNSIRILIDADACPVYRIAERILSGIPMGMRNLGEGLMYLIPYAYWQNHRA